MNKPRTHKQMKQSKISIAAIVSLTLVASCKKDMIPEPGVPDTSLIVQYIDDSLREEFNASVTGLGACLTTSSPIPNPQSAGPTTETSMMIGNQNWTCTDQPMIFGPEFSEVAVFSPDETVWVGSFLSGNAVSNGSWTPVVYDNRNSYPVTISLTAQGGTSATEVVSVPSYSSYIASHNELVSNIASGITPANMTFLHHELNAQQEVSGHIGASFGGWGASISGSYSWSSEHHTSKVLTKFVQSYYTVGVDIPSEPDHWFGNLPSYAQMASYCPVYISNIAYGRVIYITIETTSSKAELNAAVNAAYSNFAVSGSIDFECAQMQALQERNIQAFIRGGGASVGAELLASGDINTAITNGAQFSATNPGVPIAFTVRRLSDNAIVDFVTLQNYSIQTCEQTGTVVNAEIMDGHWRELCPELALGGDAEFDGHGPSVTGMITLHHDDDHVFATFDIVFDETTPDEAPGHTRATIHDTVTLYEAPFGKDISSIEANQVFYLDYLEGPEPSHEPETVYVTSDFIEELIINGDTGGDDLPCDNSPANSFMKVKFRDFQVTLIDG